MKWGGAVVSVVLLALGAWSGWYLIPVMSGRTCYADLHLGRLQIHGMGAYGFPASPLSYQRLPDYNARLSHNGPLPPAPFTLMWRLDWIQFDPKLSGLRGPWTLWVPLWLPAASCVACATIAWFLDIRARRRAKRGACPKCSYSRTGLAPDAVCPECGAAAPGDSDSA